MLQLAKMAVRLNGCFPRDCENSTYSASRASGVECDRVHNLVAASRAALVAVCQGGFNSKTPATTSADQSGRSHSHSLKSNWALVI